MRKISLRIAVFVLLTGLVNPAIAQLKLLKDDASGGRPVMSNPYSEVKGSAYLLDFEMGSIIFSELDTAANLTIAFNSYDNTLEHKMDGQLIAYYPGKISGFILNRQVVVLSANIKCFRCHGGRAPGAGGVFTTSVWLSGRVPVATAAKARLYA